MKFIPREKLSKKAKRALDAKRRQAWDINPVTRTGKNEKAQYTRKKHWEPDDGGSASFLLLG